MTGNATTAEEPVILPAIVHLRLARDRVQDAAVVKAQLEGEDRLHGADAEGHKEDHREDKGVKPGER